MVPPDSSCVSPAAIRRSLLWPSGPFWFGGVETVVRYRRLQVLQSQPCFFIVLCRFPELFLSLLKTMASCVPQRRAEESLPHRGLILYLAIWSITCSPASISEQLIRIHHRKHSTWNVAAQNGWKQTPRHACLQLANSFIDNDEDRREGKRRFWQRGFPNVVWVSLTPVPSRVSGTFANSVTALIISLLVCGRRYWRTVCFPLPQFSVWSSVVTCSFSLEKGKLALKQTLRHF